MQVTRRGFLVGSAVLGAAACTPQMPGGTPAPPCVVPALPGAEPLPVPGSAGLVDEAWFQGRATEFLTLSTSSYDPGNRANVIGHLLRSRRDPSFVWDPSRVAPTLVGTDPFRDTDDFELVDLQWVVRLGRGVLPAATIAAVEDHIAGARYRYDDPIPAGVVDNKWFWSENHRIMFAVDEYLGGLALPDRVFTFTGLTGAEHAERARPAVVAWIRERARFGYSEWHSNTYMKFDWSPLLTLVEFADDPEVVALGAAAIDTALFDLATHNFHGVFGVTHGRGYKGAKTAWDRESTFGTAKFLFDNTDRLFPNSNDIGPMYLAGSTKYRLPEVIRRAGASQAVETIRERHGVPLDPHEPFSLNPVGAFGYDYADPANLPFWWSHGALTAWQMVPTSLDACNRWNLWDSELFQKFAAVKQFASVSPGLAQVAIRELASFAAAGVLGEAHTYTWRSPEVMLSSVIDHRFGDAMEQVHAWQATLGPDTMVFTTHPSKEPPRTTDWGADSGYWTGTASMPRSAQRGRVAIHLYQPAYESPSDPLLGPYFSYRPYTHAYFPQDRFDEVVETAGWVCGRKGDAYVALWSERPTQWRTYDPATYATDGMTRPFDLLAPGGADNAWVVEVGRAADHGSFAAFVAAVAAAAPSVVRSPGRIDVTYVSPSEGELRFGTQGGFTVKGAASPLRDHPRHSSPWAEQCANGEGFDISDGEVRLQLDVAHAGRRVS
ncbi:MAG: twin-arginine translocation signal domain-containing protein [Microthrixaceae bacterium]